MILTAACVGLTSGCQSPPAAAHQAENARPPVDVAAEGAVSLVAMENVRASRGQGAVDGIGVVSADVRNAGVRDIVRVTVSISFLNGEGHAVRRERYSPVVVYGNYDLTPLRPHETRAWSGGFWDIPETWSGRIALEVVEVQLGPER